MQYFTDDYYKSLEHEIFFSVYYYHNIIGNIDLHTIGCELSEWDGERITEIIGETPSEPIIVVNTCAVTEFSQMASEKIVDLLHTIYPTKKMYIVGCGVNYNRAIYEKYGICIENENKFNNKKYNSSNKLYKNFTHNIQSNNMGLVKIQDGCHNKCAYCIINQLRKHPYCLPFDDICNQVERLLYEGKTEIQLIGTELCQYHDKDMRITDVCKKLLELFPNISSISMGALDPSSKDIERLIDFIKTEPRMYNVLCLSTQSGCDKVLKDMNRRHTSQRMRDIVEYADGKVFFSWHLIAGFPTESDEDFNETVNLIKELKPVGLDVMPFSARKGTPAYNMNNINDTKTINKRVNAFYDALTCYNQTIDAETLEKKEFDGLITRNTFYPYEIEKDNGHYCNLYDKNEFAKLYKELESGINHNLIVCNYDYTGNQYDFEARCKMLTFNFGVKIVTNFKLSDDFLANVLTDFNLRDFILYKNSFIHIIPTDEKLDEDLFYSFCNKVSSEKLYDLELLKRDLEKTNSPNLLLLNDVLSM